MTTLQKKVISIVAVIFLLAAGAYALKYINFSVLKSANPGASALGENPADKNGLTEEYISPDFGFSFHYPKGFNSSEFDDGGGHTILLQKSGAREGFQIFISAFDEPGPITPERIKKDEPDMVISEPRQVLIGGKKDIPALIFLSKRESLGNVREVWFVQKGFLYQLTAYAGMDNFIGPILETWNIE